MDPGKDYKGNNFLQNFSMHRTSLILVQNANKFLDYWKPNYTWNDIFTIELVF